MRQKVMGGAMGKLAGGNYIELIDILTTVFTRGLCLTAGENKRKPAPAWGRVYWCRN
jgi:hypothetical protein